MCTGEKCQLELKQLTKSFGKYDVARLQWKKANIEEYSDLHEAWSTQIENQVNQFSFYQMLDFF